MKSMLERSLCVIALLVPSAASFAAAQTVEDDAVIIAAIQDMRSQLGANMVVDARIRLQMADTTESAINRRLSQLGIQTGDLVAKRRCTQKGYAYYTGPEKYVTFQPPLVSGDSASIRAFWRYSGPGDKWSVTETQVLHYKKHGGSWRFIRATGVQHLDMGVVNCRDGEQ